MADAQKIGETIGTINGILAFEDMPTLMTRAIIIQYLKELKAKLENS